MLGSRSRGSSEGRFANTIGLLELVRLIISEASSNIDIGFGFPRFIGWKMLSEKKREMSPSIKSET